MPTDTPEPHDMAEPSTTLPRLTAEQRRAAVGQFERANQVLKGGAGDADYVMQLLLTCCKIDPSNLTYRQTLRQTQRGKYENNGKGQPLAPLWSLTSRLRLKRAMMQHKYAEVLIQAELICMRNPWDLGAHLAMAQAFEGLDLKDHALWTLEQIRASHPKDPRVNRPLARLYEKRGNFNQAIALWELVRVADPNDQEAQRKAKDLAASATIAKGRYEDAIKGDVPTQLVHAEKDADDEMDESEKTEPMPNVAADRNPREVTMALDRIQKNPQNANGYLHLASIYKKAEQYGKAKEVLQKALGPTANSFDITQELLDLEIEPFRSDLAVTEERLRKTPGDAELQTIRTRLNKEINTRELEVHRRRSDRFPTDTSSRFEMGLRLLRVGQTDEAIKELQAVRNDPRFHGKALFYLGFCFQARKNWRLALRNFEEALQNMNENETVLRKEAMYYLAVGHAETNDFNRALELGSDLANLDYNYKNIGTLLDQWQAKAAK
jgi:tetratricopeptide (TPR) repeat protein